MNRTLNLLLGLGLALLPFSALGGLGVSAVEGADDNLTWGFLLILMVLVCAAFVALLRDDRYPPNLPSLLAPYGLYLATIVLVLCVRVVSENQPMTILNHAGFDLASYGSVFTVLALLSFAVRREVISSHQTTRYFLLFYLAANSVLLALYFVIGPASFLSDNGVSYDPFARNLHHASIGGLAVFAIAANCLLFDIKLLSKPLLAACAVVAVTAAWFTGSSKAAATIGIMIPAIAILLLVNRSRARRIEQVSLARLLQLLYTVLISVLAMALIVGVDVIALATSQFAEVDYHEGRSVIYQVAIDTFMERPLFGRGPGSHILTSIGFRETHSTILTILVQGGIVAFLLTITAFIRWISRVPANFPVLIFLATFGFYIFFGEVLRSIAFWSALMIMTDLATRMKVNTLPAGNQPNGGTAPFSNRSTANFPPRGRLA